MGVSCRGDLAISNAAYPLVSHDIAGEGPNFSVTTVGVAVGGAIMLTAVVTVGAVFIIFICLKAR